MAAGLDGFRVCDDCGAYYLNFCVRCRRAGTEERVYELMEQHGLKEAKLIKILADHVKEGSFPALNLAIQMRDMKPATKQEVNLSAGGEIRDAKDRLGVLLGKLTKMKEVDGNK